MQRDRRLVGEGVGGDEILAAELDLVDAGFVGNHIDQAFQQIRRFGTPGAAIRVYRDGICEHRLDVAVDHRRLVNARQQRGIQVRRHGGREGGQVGAHVR